MTTAQDKLYWREWAAVKRMAGDEASENLRHDLHIRALGEDKSHKDFSNAEFDLVLGAFRAVSRPADVDAQLRQLNQRRARLVFKAKSQKVLLAVFMPSPDTYVAAILQDRFRGRRIDELSDQPKPSGRCELEEFIMTLAGRIDRMRQQAGLTVRELHESARAAVNR